MKPNLALLNWFDREPRPESAALYCPDPAAIAAVFSPKGLRVAHILNACLLLFLAASPLAAAGIRCDVFLGFDDVMTEGCWCPVNFEVQNEGPTFNATLILSSGSAFREDQSRSIAVELPTDTIKRFSIPIFVSSRGFTTWDVKIVDEKGYERHRQTGLRPRRPHLSNNTALFGALPRTAGGLPVLPKPLSVDRTPETPVTARIQTATFPDNPLLLDSLTALYLNSEIATVLRPAQANALLSWLRAGGHLVIGLEQPGDLAAAPWLRAVAPFEPKDLQQLTLNGQFRDWVNASLSRRPLREGEPGPLRGPRIARPELTSVPEDETFDRGSLLALLGTPQGEVLLRAGETPLVIERVTGRGKVTVLCFSPEREPFKSWRSAPEFWAALLRVEPPGPNQQYNYANFSTDGVWGALVETKQVHRLPVAWLLVILVGYLAVIGPIDQMVLKRMNRQMLTWITFPCYVLAFSLLIYFIGYKLRAGEIEWNEINVVDVLPAGEKTELRGRTYASIYSPANQSYDLASNLRYAALRTEYRGPNQGTTDSETIRIQQKDDAFNARAMVSVWTSRMFVSDWWQAAESPVQAGITRSGVNLTISVTNRLAKPLRNVRVVYAGRLNLLGQVPARSSTNFVFQPSSGMTLADCANRWTGSFQQASQQRRNAFGSNRELLPDRMDSAVGASVIGSLGRFNQVGYQFTDPGKADLPALSEGGQAVLFAWVDGFSPVPSANKFKPLRENHETLLRLAVPVSQ